MLDTAAIFELRRRELARMVGMYVFDRPPDLVGILEQVSDAEVLEYVIRGRDHVIRLLIAEGERRRAHRKARNRKRELDKRRASRIRRGLDPNLPIQPVTPKKPRPFTWRKPHGQATEKGAGALQPGRKPDPNPGSGDSGSQA